MAKSIAQRLAALEKTVAEFIGARPKKKKAKRAKKAKKAKKKAVRGKAARKRKPARRRNPPPQPFPAF